jgi:Fungal tRNA ligase phosphodiesterase domain
MATNGATSVGYTAVLLDEASVAQLISHFHIPQGWSILCHHMTINMGEAIKGPASHLVGQNATLTVKAVAQNDKVMAVAVDSLVPSQNPVKHITIAVNRAGGGKPVMSNQLTGWTPIQHFQINGVVAEVAHGGTIIRR